MQESGLPQAAWSITMSLADDEHFMAQAIAEARLAAAAGDIPVGAVAVAAGQVVAKGHNLRELLQDPTAHAEIIALRQAASELGTWRLSGLTLYCTMEPCPMCAGAMVQARLGRLVYAVDDPKAGAAGSILDLLRSPWLNHQVLVTRGILAQCAQAQLSEYFARLRS